jgi:iron(III) transport system ATP-binding protein
VTHDQSEALALSHEIAVMNEGQIVQVGSPRDIYERPHNRFVADFVGSANFLDATVAGRGDQPDCYHVRTTVGLLECSAVEPLREGDTVVLSVRPEDVHVSAERQGDRNVLTGTVDAKIFLGESLEFRIKVGDAVLLARVHPSFSPTVGTPVHLKINPDKCIAIPDEGQRNHATH